MKRELCLEDIKFQQLVRRIPTASKNVPVPGYYQLLKRIPGKYTGDAARYNKYLYEAYYNPFGPDFTHKYKVPVMIWSLYNDCSTGPKEATLEELQGTVINLSTFGIYTNTFTDNLTGKENEWTSYKAVWEMIGLATESVAVDLSAIFPATELTKDGADELELIDPDFEDELENILSEANIELIDDETELVFWEANQPNWGMSEAEIELLLDQADDDKLKAN